MATALREPAEQLTLSIPEATRRPVFRLLPWADIDPDPDQPRKDADVGLRAAIAANGMLEPVKVRPHPDVAGRWMLIDGERRYRSAEGLLTELPAVIREDLDQRPTRLRTQLVFNSGKQLSAMEKAHVLDELLREPGATLASVARDTGLARSTIGDHVSLMRLGPWIPLIESGDVASSFATRVLVPLAGCADDVHDGAVKRFLEIYDDAERRKTLTFDAFQDDVEHIYAESLYPLTTLKHYHQNPEFNTKAHDAECDCGRISLDPDHDPNGKKRDFCGNPGWWKPLLAAAKKAAKAKAKESGASTTSPARQAERRGVDLYLPEGHSLVKGPDYVYEPPKGTEWLTDSDGRWATSTLHLGDDAFDPRLAAGNVAAAELVLYRGNGGASRAAIKTGALKAARAEWAKRWATRRAELEAERLAVHKANKAFEAVLSLSQDAVTLLLADCWDLQFYARESKTGPSREFLGWQLVAECGALLKVPAIEEELTNPVPAWIKEVGAAIARRVLRAWLVARRDRWEPIDTVLESEERSALHEISKLKCPWLKAPKGGKTKAATPTASMLDDDGDTDLGDDDDG